MWREEFTCPLVGGTALIGVTPDHTPSCCGAFHSVGTPNGRDDGAHAQLLWYSLAHLGTSHIHFVHSAADRHRDIHHANITLSYHLMPYVGLLTSGVAATAEAMVEIPDLLRK